MNARTSPSTPIRTLATTLLVGLLATVGMVVGSTGPVHAATDDVTWTVRTASNDLGSERTSYSYTINPGSTVDDALVVVNRGTESLDLGVYAADGYTTDSGQFDLVVAGADSTNVGAWVKGDATSITVGPGETVTMPFAVSVPEDATPGDYAGGIVTSLVQGDDAHGINVDRRLGIRIALRVGGDLKPAMAVENPQLTWNGGLNPFAGGDATLNYTLHNTGNAVLSAQQAATLSGPFGWFPYSVSAIDAPPQLLPGETWRVTVPVPNVAAVLFLSASATVTPIVIDASGSTTTLTPVVADATGPAVPWMAILIVVALVIFVLVGLRLQKRRALRRKAEQDTRVQEAVDAALAEKETVGVG